MARRFAYGRQLSVYVPEHKKNWALTRGAFDLLLAGLDPDRDRAGDKYELLRRKLITFFVYRGSGAPEDDADQSIDRVCRRLAEGEVIHDLPSYCAGIARLVAHEEHRQRHRERRVQPEINVLQHATDVDEGLRSECSSRCLKTLPLEAQEFLLTYVKGDWHARASTRREMASRLGISPTALRIRVHRLRARLEHCMVRCMRRSAETTGDSSQITERTTRDRDVS